MGTRKVKQRGYSLLGYVAMELGKLVSTFWINENVKEAKVSSKQNEQKNKLLSP
jgi:hypothetical protein